MVKRQLHDADANGRAGVNSPPWADNNLADVNIGRLLDREHDGAGDRLGRQREPDPSVSALSPPDSSRLPRSSSARTQANDRHAQLLAGLQ
jgi:hypothetical protein